MQHRYNPLRIAGISITRWHQTLRGVAITIADQLEGARSTWSSPEQAARAADQAVRDDLTARGIRLERISCVSRASTESLECVKALVAEDVPFLIVDLVSRMENYFDPIRAYDMPYVERGTGQWGVSLAIVLGTEPIVAAARLPHHALTVTAVRGKHLWSDGEWHGYLRRRFPPSPRERIRIGLEWPWQAQSPERRLEDVCHALHALQDFGDTKILGSPLVSATLVAMGVLDAIVHLGNDPYEQAASGLFLREAGALVTTASNAPWDVLSSTMVAAAPKIHDAVMARLKAYSGWDD